MEFISMTIDHAFLGPPGATNAISYRGLPFCESCIEMRTVVDLARMFHPVNQDEADLLNPVAQAYLEATMHRIDARPGTRCRGCRVDVGAPDPTHN